MAALADVGEKTDAGPSGVNAAAAVRPAPASNRRRLIFPDMRCSFCCFVRVVLTGGGVRRMRGRRTPPRWWC
ncbi:hypothetical protein GCM10010399_85940 [Dactylosporangium fulvum]